MATNRNQGLFQTVCNQQHGDYSMIPRTLAAAVVFFVGAHAGGAAVRPEVARLFPPDSATVAGIDIEAVRDTPLFRRLVPGFPFENDERAAKFFSAVGFDPKEDVHSVYLASDSVPGEAKAQATLTIVEGRFDVAGRGNELMEIFSPAGEHGGFQLYQSDPKGGAAGLPVFVFLDSGTAILGAGPHVTAAIDRWLDAGGQPSKPALAALSQKDAHIWAATLEPNKLLGPWVDQVPGGGGPLRAIADAMQGLAIRATALSGSIHAEIALLCSGTDDARSLADAAQAMAAFGALTTQRDRPELAGLLGRLQVRQNENETTLSLDLTDAQLLGLRPN